MCKGYAMCALPVCTSSKCETPYIQIYIEAVYSCMCMYKPVSNMCTRAFLAVEGYSQASYPNIITGFC